jgi:hypothetical protein
VSDTTTDDQADDQQERPAVERLRGALERARRRNAELEPLTVENAELKRQLGLARAGVDPTSWLGQIIATAAAADGVDDPDRVVDIALSLRAELNGGRGRQEEE